MVTNASHPGGRLVMGNGEQEKGIGRVPDL
jgi:hypothetical protein